MKTPFIIQEKYCLSRKMCVRIGKCCKLIFTEGTNTCCVLKVVGWILAISIGASAIYFTLMGVGVGFFLFGPDWENRKSNEPASCASPLQHWAACPGQGLIVVLGVFLILALACGILAVIAVVVYYSIVRPIRECKEKWDETGTVEEKQTLLSTIMTE